MIHNQLKPTHTNRCRNRTILRYVEPAFLSFVPLVVLVLLLPMRPDSSNATFREEEDEEEDEDEEEEDGAFLRNSHASDAASVTENALMPKNPPCINIARVCFPKWETSAEETAHPSVPAAKKS